MLFNSKYSYSALIQYLVALGFCNAELYGIFVITNFKDNFHNIRGIKALCEVVDGKI